MQLPTNIVEAVRRRAEQIDNPPTEETIEFVYDEGLTCHDELRAAIAAHGYNAVFTALSRAIVGV